MAAPMESPAGRGVDVVAAAARVLAAAGAEAAGAVLASVCESLGCDEVVLHGPAATDVLARASRARAPQPRARTVLDVPVRFGGALHGVLTAVSGRPLTVRQAQTLSAVADVLALAFAATGPNPLAAAGRTILDEEADRAELAADLFESVRQRLVTVRYAAELVAVGRAAAADLDDPVRAALVAMREAHRDLRAYALEAGLRAALRELEARAAGDRPDDGRPPLRLTVEADDPGLDDVPPPVAVTVQRVAQAALRGAAGRARVTALVDGSAVKLWVRCADNAYDAGELVRWSRRVSALGGALRDRPDGVDVTLPVPSPAEGHHDDRPHL